MRPPLSPDVRAFPAVLLVLALVGFAAASVAIDVFAAGRAPGVVLLLATAFATPAFAIAAISRARWMGAACGVAWVLLALVVSLPWHPRKRFVRSVFAVTPGMTVGEVERVLDGYIKGRGAKWDVPTAAPVGGGVPTLASGSLTYRWSDDAAYDSDWGVVTFRDGRVVAVDFLGD